jgi:hypothetical protein
MEVTDLQSPQKKMKEETLAFRSVLLLPWHASTFLNVYALDMPTAMSL